MSADPPVRLLIVHHTTSPNLAAMLDAVRRGTGAEGIDVVYYPCREATAGRPYALYVHGGDDTTGAVRAVEGIAAGLGWRRLRPPVSVTGPPGRADLDACWELGATMAAELAGFQ